MQQRQQPQQPQQATHAQSMPEPQLPSLNAPAVMAQQPPQHQQHPLQGRQQVAPQQQMQQLTVAADQQQYVQQQAQVQQQVYRTEDDDDDDGGQDEGAAKAIRGKNWRTNELLELVNAWQYCLDHKSGIDEKSAQFNARVHERFAMHCRGECGAQDGICKRNAKSVGDKMASIKLMYKFIKDFNTHKKIPDSEDKPDWFVLDKKERKDFARRYDRQQFQIQVYEKLRAMFDPDESPTDPHAVLMRMPSPTQTPIHPAMLPQTVLVMPTVPPPATTGEKRRADDQGPTLVAPHPPPPVAPASAKRPRVPVATNAPRIDLTTASVAGAIGQSGLAGADAGVVALGNAQLDAMNALITQQTNMFLKILQETRQADREDQERLRKAEAEERKQDRDAFLQAFRMMMETMKGAAPQQQTYRSL